MGMPQLYGYRTLVLLLRSLKMNFTIPETTPPGYYLIRAEHNNLSQDGEGTQFFIGCAHVQIIGPGGGESLSTQMAGIAQQSSVLTPSCK